MRGAQMVGRLARRCATVVSLIATVALTVAPATLAAAPRSAPGPRPPYPPGLDVVSVGGGAPSRPLPPAMSGVSLEYNTVTAYEGTSAQTADPVLAQLIRNLAPGQTPILRIAGDSTDWTWWPIKNISRPPGATNSLTPTWLQRARTLAQSTKARLILGINLEADNPRIASVEATNWSTGSVASPWPRSRSATSRSCIRSSPGTRPPPGRGGSGGPSATTWLTTARVRQLRRGAAQAAAGRTGDRSFVAVAAGRIHPDGEPAEHRDLPLLRDQQHRRRVPRAQLLDRAHRSGPSDAGDAAGPVRVPGADAPGGTRISPWPTVAT